nr:unnamed protein product [Callosobruchus chinensis]
MFMLAYWRLNKAPADIQTLEIDIKREEYEQVLGNYSTVLRLGEQWDISDWKTSANEVLKKPGQWHFRFNESKRFILTKSSKKVMIRNEAFLGLTLCNKNSDKKRKKHVQLKTKSLQGTLKGDKSTIDNLLKSHYGQDWRNNPELELYKIIDGGNSPGENVEEGSQEEYKYEDKAAAIMV